MEQQYDIVSAEGICEKIKQLRKYNDEQQSETDDVLLFACQRSMDIVKAYCNIQQIPNELENVCIEMSMLLFDNENYEQAHKNTAIKTIQEGNVSITYQNQSNAWKDNKKELLKGFSEELDKFRCMKW